MIDPIIGDQSGVFLNKLYYCGDCNTEMRRINLSKCLTCVNSGNIAMFICLKCNKKIKVFQGESCINCDEILDIGI